MSDLTPYADKRGIIRSVRIADAGDRSALRRHALEGSLVRLARGAYLDQRMWAQLSKDERYRAIVHAVAGAGLHDDDVLCGPSALALWRLPSLDAWPAGAHLVRPRRSGGHGRAQIVRHTTSRPYLRAEIDGLPVTSLARTVVDTAARGPLAAGLMAADAALRGLVAPGFSRPAVTRDDVRAEAERVPVRHGRARALLVARLADARAESPGESLLRASIHLLGLPMPELQWEFRGDSGRRFFADCYWPDQEFVLEFDGRAKYLDPALRGGRTAEEVVVAEKEREDEIRAQVRGMTRAGWSVARSPAQLEARLRRAGFVFPGRRHRAGSSEERTMETTTQQGGRPRVPRSSGRAPRTGRAR